MNIDFHGHFIPLRLVDAAATGKEFRGIRMSRTGTGALIGEAEGKAFDLPEWTMKPETPETRIAELDAMRLDAQVLSIAPRLQRYKRRAGRRGDHRPRDERRSRRVDRGGTEALPRARASAAAGPAGLGRRG